MTVPHRFVLATHNAAKITEYRFITERVLPGWEPIGYEGAEPIEDGLSFEENALIKARAAVASTGRAAVADDSGLCVDVLGGAPGIFSAYWAGHRKDLTANRDLLLDQIADIADEHRGASFTSAVALVTAAGEEHLAIAEWRGRLARAPEGDDGFPYDSIFIPDEDHIAPGRPIALWPDELRHSQSHRMRAFRHIAPALRAYATQVRS